MRQNVKKLVAFVCAVTMMITLVPVGAQAATKKAAFAKSVLLGVEMVLIKRVGISL